MGRREEAERWKKERWVRRTELDEDEMRERREKIFPLAQVPHPNIPAGLKDALPALCYLSSHEIPTKHIPPFPSETSAGADVPLLYLHATSSRES